MRANFSASLALLLKSEGGYVRDPQDPGGATNEGITQAVYDDWRTREGLPRRAVLLINDYEAGIIYRRRYWDTVRGDDLPSGVDYCSFDAAVNSGPKEAVLWLQRAAQVQADGAIGPVTLTAVKAADPRRIINSVCSQRLAFMETLSTWPHFGTGWSRRVAAVEQDARSMVG